MRYFVFGLAFAVLATGQLSAATSCWGRLNRFFGLGWGDGYHVGSSTDSGEWPVSAGELVPPKEAGQQESDAAEPEPQANSWRGWFVPDRNSAVHHPPRFVRLPPVDTSPQPATGHAEAGPPSLVRLPSLSPDRKPITKLR